jgi:ComF family protein
MNLILDLLFPKKCVGCKKIGTYFCSDCIAEIKQTDLVCPKCERPSIGGVTHPVCRRKFGLDGLWSLGIYQDPLKKAIQKLKYKRIQEFSQILVDITLEYWALYQPFVLDQIKKDQARDWIVIPVPLYWTRQNDRGFNQSSLVGKLLADKLGLEYSEVLKRTRHTKQQVGLRGGARHQNIKNAFAINSNLDIQSRFSRPFGSQNDKVLLVDDVWTTGSTLRECCYILKRNGAKQVWAVTLAR